MDPSTFNRLRSQELKHANERARLDAEREERHARATQKGTADGHRWATDDADFEDLKNLKDSVVSPRYRDGPTGGTFFERMQQRGVAGHRLHYRAPPGNDLGGVERTYERAFIESALAVFASYDG